MISVSDLRLSYGERTLFKDVNLKFTKGNCYGIIGANGAGKSTFLKILNGETEYDKGEISISEGERLAVLRQDHFAFDDYSVTDTVMAGYPRLFSVLKEKEALYAKDKLSDEEGMRAAELEGEFAELGGWEAESQIGIMLSGLGLGADDQGKMMSELDENRKVRVLLAQALFGNPDILLLDEPTNGLDLESIAWLEDFLIDFPNIVIVVSHDRHFLNAVCTNICDIDMGKITAYSGNYDFWYEMSRMLQRQARDQLKKREEKAKELKEFIRRFASNAAKSRQATSRKKVLEKLDLTGVTVTSRKFPSIMFRPAREIGNNVLRVEKLSIRAGQAEEGGVRQDGDGGGSPFLVDNFSLIVRKTDKIAFVGQEKLAISALFDVLAGVRKQDGGDYYWGQTTSVSYFPRDNTEIFAGDESITGWLKQYSDEKDDTYVRGFLGRMLFSGDEALKPLNVLSGGEKVRCLLAKMMLSGANVLILDEPTNHLDLESITALNRGLIQFPGVVLFTSHDHEFTDTIANRIIELVPGGFIDRMMTFDEYLRDRAGQKV